MLRARADTRALMEHFARYESCTCRADAGTESEAAGAHQERACGPFPCTDGGCYVQRCGTDDDCAIGLCSSHASWPSGYCVNSDPK